jgi:hypothetical protein
MIADYLRARLIDLDMSYADLAGELSNRGYDVTRSAVQHWVSGKNIPPVEDKRFRVLLASALQLDSNDMMMRFGYYTFESDRSREARRAADMIDLLPDDQKSFALEYLDLMVRRYKTE